MDTRRLAALATAVLVVMLAWSAIGLAPAANGGAAPPTTASDGGAVTTVADNPFLPEDRNLSECISAAPRPGCGSEARGGWRQTLVFVVMAAALVFVGWRIVRSMRRRDVRS